ncbi:hypothetical protein MRX96_018526 [Rhipicephalus microplus]
MVLYLLMGHSVTYQWYAHAAFLLAFTYCLNNTLVIISAVASPSTKNHLQRTLYLGAATVMVLYLLTGHSMTYQWYMHAVVLLAFTYCLKPPLVFISAMALPSTQNHLQKHSTCVTLVLFIYLVFFILLASKSPV